MNAKTELLLYRLLWLVEKPLRPTFRNLELSFEGWAYRGGLMRQIRRLESQGYLESKIDPATGDRLHRLTETGRLTAFGGRDPEAAWSRPWDGKWRLFLFDIPESERSARRKLTRALSSSGCGCLQGSVWIAPHVPAALECLVAGDETECSRLLLLLADSKGKRTDQRMVVDTWNFETINGGYLEVLAVLDRFSSLAATKNRETLDQWTGEESARWKTALAADPLLPAELLPKDYLGRKAWHRRKAVLADAARVSATIAAGVS